MPGLQEIVVNVVIILGNIALMFVILRLLVYKPLRRYMLQRSERIGGQIAQAEKMMSEARAMRDDMDREEMEHVHQSELKLKESEAQARQRAEEIIGDAQRKASDILSEARTIAEAERKSAIEGLSTDIADMAIQISAKVLEREISVADNQHVIDEFFKKVI